MMGETYGGESVGKKLARLEFWRRAQLWHGSGFAHSRHLVLASREGGDISILRALGVPARNILAVDIDHEALDACVERYPGIIALHGDVSDVLAEQSCLATVFLDFCGWATDGQISAVAAACSAVIDHGIVGHGFMRGREQGPHRVQIETERTLSLGRRRSEYARLGIDDNRLSRDPDSDGRHGWVLDRLRALTNPLRIAPLLLFTLSYHSTCSWRRGVPMRIYARQVERWNRCTPERIFLREAAAYGQQWCGVLAGADGAAWITAESAGVDPREANGFELVIDIPIDDTDRKVSAPIGKNFCDRSVLSLLNLVAAAEVADAIAPGKAHELLNLRKGRLAALRAHASRGTYDQECAA